MDENVIKRYVDPESLANLQRKTADVCDILVRLFEDYVSRFHDGTDEPVPLLLEGAKTIEQQDEMLAEHRRFARDYLEQQMDLGPGGGWTAECFGHGVIGHGSLDAKPRK